MATTQLEDEIGCWIKEKMLGTGGFGYVILWRNKETNDTIALKECRWGHDPTMTPKHRDRWKKEVDIMLRLNHPNVVKAIPVPPELDVPPTELPLLAMEFCNNGDLRKLLCKPENCCGLKEKHVRLIMKHISSAVNYLHSKRIIHRDLKPENIVIQSQNKNVVYKLIDLGYAKELDQGSLCTSFVGTLQYLAPELFMSQKYSCTVDYWSLGLVTYEVITGSRPFLPDKSPAEWIPIIKQKNSTQIRAYLDQDKNIEFSSKISPFIYISNSFKQDVEKWLQLMLDWDPMKRGRNGETTFLSLLETILSKKIALVFSVGTLKLYSLPVSDGLSLQKFSEQLEKETGIPVDQQEILLPNGLYPDSSKSAEQFVSDMEKEEYIVYLFDSKNASSLPQPTSATYISPSVETMMRNPREEVDYMCQRTVWSEAVYLSQQECIRTSRVLNAFKAFVTNLVAKNSCAHKNVSRMTAEMNKLIAKCEFLKRSLELDVKCYKKRYQKGILSSKQVLENWENALQNLQKIDLLKQKVIKVEADFSNISSQAVQLHKSPLLRSKLTAATEEIYERILESYSELRKRPREKRRIEHDNIDFVRLLCMCLQHNHSQTQDLLLHIRKVKQLKKEIDDSLPQIINLSYEITEWEAEIANWQTQRQRDMWNMIDSLNSKLLHSESLITQSSPVGSPEFMPQLENNSNCRCEKSAGSSQNCAKNSKLEFPRSRPSSAKHSSPVIIPPSSSSSDVFTRNRHSKEECSILGLTSSSITGNLSLSYILDQSSKENQRVRKESQNLAESFQTMMDIFQSYKDSDATDTLK